MKTFTKEIQDDETHIGYEIKTANKEELINAFCWKFKYPEKVRNEKYDETKPETPDNSPVKDNPLPENVFALMQYAAIGVDILQEFRQYKKVQVALNEVGPPIDPTITA